MELLLDVRWMLTFLTLFNLLDLKVLCIPVCNNIIVGNSTHNSAGEVTSPDFPALQSTTYTCLFEFEGRSSGEYLELIFTDFILDSQDTVACHGSVDLLYTVSIRENVRQGPGVRHCERPKRHVFSLTGLATLELKSRSQHILQAFRATYRFLNASEGERLGRQTTHEVTRYNYDPRDNYQGSIKDEIDLTGRERWVDVIHYIRAPSGHRVALNAAFMQDHRTTTFEIHDGATSSAEQIAQSLSSSRSVYKSGQEWIYVRWYGEAGGGVALDIDFTFFKDPGSSGVCAGDYFKCTNDICIPNKLLCNGVDNCYDGPTSNDEDPQGECRAIMTKAPVPLHSAIIIPQRTSVMPDNTRTCPTDLCRNGGLCVNNVCVCQEGYTGTYCDSFDNTGGPDYTDLQHTSIMIGAFVGAVCLLSICWLIAMARKRQTDAGQPEGRLQRIISVHSPDENGLRRQSTLNVQSNVELPPNYSEAILYREGSFVGKNSQRSSVVSNRRISADEPLSPPPSYDAVASEPEEDAGIVFRIPESVPEGDEEENENDDVENGQQLHILLNQNNALPDVVTSQETSETPESNPPLTRHDTPV